MCSASVKAGSFKNEVHPEEFLEFHNGLGLCSVHGCNRFIRLRHAENRAEGGYSLDFRNLFAGGDSFTVTPQRIFNAIKNHRVHAGSNRGGCVCFGIMKS